MGEYLACFKAYDVRGIVPDELNPDIAYAVGRAYADATGARTVCIGRDIRLSGPALAESLARGLREAGVDVVDLGMVGTEVVYFATAHYGFDGGIMITASHNPPQYNGMKLVREGSRPISGDTGLFDIERRAAQGAWERSGAGGVRTLDPYPDFVNHILSVVDPATLRPLRVLANAGNGAAGPALEMLADRLPLEIVPMHFGPDGSFPHGVPNPILPESRAETEARLAEGGFDLGVAWDGDYDRCFLFDDTGAFVEGYYIVGLLADAVLRDDPTRRIVYDPRLYWNTLEIVAQHGGHAIMSKTGHAFIKERMRAEDAFYGGEMSAHHYFKSHWYCDSGVLPFLLVAQLVSRAGTSLGGMVGRMIERYPCSGEINSTVPSVPEVLARVRDRYADGEVADIDGLGVDYPDWRFNLRGSNTEPVIRLNVETRGDRDLLQRKVDELLAIIRA